ncbi:hypothetical protein [uncultured Shewanella sp.]|uniref:hypothetical protein n=1 Tax=uncultured Shewanella sp. TaxID=173975 RepID=UPI00260E4BCC|nr:hypothetical protein [uncultured Shewanella sp.]
MGNKLKRKNSSKLKAKKSRLQKQNTRKVNNNSVDVDPDEVICCSQEMISVFKRLPKPDENFSHLPQLINDLELRSLSKTGEIQDFEAATALASIQYVHWYLTGSDALLKEELFKIFDTIIDHHEFKKQILKPFSKIEHETDFFRRKKQFKKELTNRLNKRLETSSFDELTSNGSKLKFEMSLAINGYPFELDDKNPEDYQSLLTDDEYASGEFDEIIHDAFLDAKAQKIKALINGG